MFNTLNNVQNVSQIVSVFSHGKTPEELKPSASEKPLFVILVGAPGVGKSTQAKKILANHGKEYDSFYNVSLDSIVEQIVPYRTATKTLYHTFTEDGTTLTDEELAMLSEVYLATIMSKDHGFNLNYTVRRITKKHRGNENKLKKPVVKNKSLATLVDLRMEGLEYGIEQGYNILYDTTFRKSKNIMASDILPLLEQYPEHEYQIHVIHVTATKDQIRMQLNKRHQNMIKNGYIRAISPKLIGMFMMDNKQGFDIAKEYFMSGEYVKDEPTTQYDPSRFTFETIDNKFISNVAPTPLNQTTNNIMTRLNQLSVKNNSSNQPTNNLSNQLAKLSVNNKNSNKNSLNTTRKRSTVQ
jgi:hypothetical protein